MQKHHANSRLVPVRLHQIPAIRAQLHLADLLPDKLGPNLRRLRHDLPEHDHRNWATVQNSGQQLQQQRTLRIRQIGLFNRHRQRLQSQLTTPEFGGAYAKLQRRVLADARSPLQTNQSGVFVQEHQTPPDADQVLPRLKRHHEPVPSSQNLCGHFQHDFYRVHADHGSAK